MTHIIAGRFDQQESAQHALQEILRAGFPAEQVTTFYVNPPGQHDLYKIGGDHDTSVGAEKSPGGVAAGVSAGGVAGAAIGAATIPVLGPVGPVAGGLVGAHVGSLMGSMHEMRDDGQAASTPETRLRRAGMMLAVCADTAEQEDRAIDVLRALDAQDIERAEGTIADGDWEDFDPLTPPLLVERPH